jgi:hypothetical protein
MPSIPELSDHMLSKVLGFLPRGDLLNVALTCRKVLPTVQKSLYTSIDMYRPYADARTSVLLVERTCLLARTLIGRPDFANYVRSLSITVSDHRHLLPADTFGTTPWQRALHVRRLSAQRYITCIAYVSSILL